jgi:Protein kinase domain/PEGA domain
MHPADIRVTISCLPRGAVPLHTDAAGTAPPDAFGPFRVLHQIGAGTLGPVFRAYDAQQDRLVTVKQFKLDLLPERLHQLVAEFEGLIAAELNHPFIAAPIATGTDGITVYLARDFVAADSLDVAVRDRRVARPSEIIRVAEHVAWALDSAAAVNVLHGALHPRDVLISSDEIRLTDLGIARALETVDATPPLRRPYAAPERIAGSWDRRSDTFSLAALVYELVAGRRLSVIGEEAAQLLPPVQDADDALLRAVFARALAENPAKRFETAAAFADALKNALPETDRAEAQQSWVIARAAGDEEAEEVRTERSGQTPSDFLPTGEPSATGDDLRLPLDEAPEAFAFTDDEVARAQKEVESARARQEMRIVAATDDELDQLGLLPTEVEEHPEPEVPLAKPAGDVVRLMPPVETPSEKAAVGKPAAEPPLAAAWMEPPDAAESVRPPKFEQADSSRTEALEEAAPWLRRWGVWRIAALLILGAGLGFGGGYLTRSREGNVRATPPADQPAAPTAATSGNDATTPADTPGPAAPTAGNREATRSGLPDRTAANGTPAAGQQLLVQSTPNGARVFVDGRDVGRTPASVSDLARGQHRVRVVQDGFVTEERRVVIAGSGSQALNVTLERPRTAVAAKPAAPPVSATTGSLTTQLKVESRPTNARVFVDGRLIGTTPLALEQIEAGEHNIRLELDGYRSWSTVVRIVEGKGTRVGASLEMNE